MTQAEALRLIRSPQIDNKYPSCWADLGAGNGVFTRALSSLLAPGSSILAVDLNQSSLNAISVSPGIVLKTIKTDIASDRWFGELLDGILMANSIHFIKDKNKFLGDIAGQLKPGGQILLVEYDLAKANPWVPYPLPFETMKKLFRDTLGKNLEKLGEMPSKYNRAMIYGGVTS